jgi:hypothetical protein
MDSTGGGALFSGPRSRLSRSLSGSSRSSLLDSSSLVAFAREGAAGFELDDVAVAAAAGLLAAGLEVEVVGAVAALAAEAAAVLRVEEAGPAGFDAAAVEELEAWHKRIRI